jgi:hypothetical protein
MQHKPTSNGYASADPATKARGKAGAIQAAANRLVAVAGAAQLKAAHRGIFENLYYPTI